MHEADRPRWWRATFDDDAELYDRHRPVYPSQLFDDLRQMTGLGPQSRVLEIGCGTGQATVPLARLDCRIVAVELGANMATVARRNLAAFPDVEVVVATFEDWPLPAEKFDLVLSATAFHWIDPDVRMVKAADALLPGGALAVISTHHVAGGSDDFFADAQACYRIAEPTTPDAGRHPEGADIPDDTGEFDRSGRFGPVHFKRYEWAQTYSTDEFIGLLSTYSNHRTLVRRTRESFLSCIAETMDRGYHGRIAKRYLTQLAVSHAS